MSGSLRGGFVVGGFCRTLNKPIDADVGRSSARLAGLRHCSVCDKNRHFLKLLQLLLLLLDYSLVA